MNELQGLDCEITQQETRLERLQTIRQAMVDDPAKFEPVLARTLRLWGEGTDERDLVWNWLCKPLLRLEDRMPLEMVIEGRTEEVLRLISAIESGAYQ